MYHCGFLAIKVQKLRSKLDIVISFCFQDCRLNLFRVRKIFSFSFYFDLKMFKVMQTYERTTRYIDKGLISNLVEVNGMFNEMVYFNGYID